MSLREEGPTLALLTCCYAAFFGLTLAAGTLPLVFVICGLALVVALHSSLQHEVVHGHPFTQTWASDATVFPALGLLIPYLRFKDTHLAHHYDPNLTDPHEDPESNFLDPDKWAKLPSWRRAVAKFNNTLLGRMLIGPVVAMAAFYRDDIAEMLNSNWRIQVSYVLHALGVMPVLLWVAFATDMPLWAYVLSAYLGMSLLKIRTFLEHRAEQRAAARSVVIEDRGLLAFLFLNNNYHAVHHAYPRVVWHKLPKLFSERREDFLRRNGGYLYASYWQIFMQYFFNAKDPVAHPLWTAEEGLKHFGGKNAHTRQPAHVRSARAQHRTRGVVEPCAGQLAAERDRRPKFADE